MSEKKSHPHLLYMDILRTFAILAVIMLHCVSELLVEPALYGTPAWHALNILNTLGRTGVPLFFMISGSLIISDERPLTPGQFLMRRIPKIFIPFFIWNVVYYVYFACTTQSYANVGDFFYGFAAMGISYHFWFVYTLIFIYLLIPIIKPFLTRATNVQLIYALFVILFPATICPLINKLCGVWLFRFDSAILGYAGFTVMGYLLGRTKLSLRVRLIIYACGIGGALLGVLGTISYSSPELIDAFFNGGYSLPAYCTSAALFVLFKELSKKITSRRAAHVFFTLSSLTYGVYLIHVLVMEIIFADHTPEHVGLTVPLQFVVTTVVSFAVTFLISRVKVLKKILI
ncbi:MAG: acyltransferase [Clostridia bacterium]|nr:acyltransferase [Clostridia bacterium]